MSKWIAAILGIIFLAFGATTRAQDWPQWRGANRDGKLFDFVAPQTWPTVLNKKWTVPVGIGDSSPVLVGNNLYTFGRQENNEIIRCLDRHTGKVIWQHAYPKNSSPLAPAQAIRGHAVRRLLLRVEFVRWGLVGSSHVWTRRPANSSGLNR